MCEKCVGGPLVYVMLCGVEWHQSKCLFDCLSLSLLVCLSMYPTGRMISDAAMGICSGRRPFDAFSISSCPASSEYTCMPQALVRRSLGCCCWLTSAVRFPLSSARRLVCIHGREASFLKHELVCSLRCSFHTEKEWPGWPLLLLSWRYILRFPFTCLAVSCFFCSLSAVHRCRCCWCDPLLIDTKRNRTCFDYNGQRNTSMKTNQCGLRTKRQDGSMLLYMVTGCSYDAP